VNEGQLGESNGSDAGLPFGLKPGPQAPGLQHKSLIAWRDHSGSQAGLHMLLNRGDGNLRLHRADRAGAR